ncbi:hypothetical protein [Robertmurraya korlensis]|uniref:hypothetical protein n=1 Tax=Robertmurraya korlensis TaxID=519977 RepID=UPI000823FD40|nr:hypothetical protein [Robertmurraya korlensis]
MKRGSTPHILQALLESHEQFIKSKMPMESQNHFRQAHKEVLMGIRTWIDHQMVERETSMSHSNHQAVKKINISD